MKKYLLILLCLLTLRLDATPTEPVEPVGQRLGLSLIEVLDSIYKEGVYHYTGSSGKPRTPDAPLTARFQDKSGERSLNYGFVRDKCDLAMMVLPLSDLDSIVQLYDRQFPSTGKQMWRTPYGQIKITVVTGAESARNDHKSHLVVFFDPSL